MSGHLYCSMHTCTTCTTGYSCVRYCTYSTDLQSLTTSPRMHGAVPSLQHDWVILWFDWLVIPCIVSSAGLSALSKTPEYCTVLYCTVFIIFILIKYKSLEYKYMVLLLHSVVLFYVLVSINMFQKNSKFGIWELSTCYEKVKIYKWFHFLSLFEKFMSAKVSL